MASEAKDPIASSDENKTETKTSIVREGKAEILVSDKKVFYNPVQEFNRDLRFVNSIIFY